MTTLQSTLVSFPPPHIARVRHDLKRRTLTVCATQYLTPGMLRLTLKGEDLADFASAAPDDHIKLFVPTTSGEPERRDYTPRRFDPSALTLAIDFAVHDAGPATLWAMAAQIGDRIEIGGPRGSAVISKDVRRWLLIGDETALPAIGRRIEEADRTTHITSVVAVAGPQDHQTFDTPASLTAFWVHRPLTKAADPSAMLDVLRTLHIEAGTFVWIAAEAGVTRAVRAHIEGRGLPAGWMKASGYWVMGKADAHEKFE